jgi:hypothetical protein
MNAVKNRCAEGALHTGPGLKLYILWGLKRSNARKRLIIRGLKVLIRTRASWSSYGIDNNLIFSNFICLNFTFLIPLSNVYSSQFLNV